MGSIKSFIPIFIMNVAIQDVVKGLLLGPSITQNHKISAKLRDLTQLRSQANLPDPLIFVIGNKNLHLGLV